MSVSSPRGSAAALPSSTPSATGATPAALAISRTKRRRSARAASARTLGLQLDPQVDDGQSPRRLRPCAARAPARPRRRRGRAGPRRGRGRAPAAATRRASRDVDAGAVRAAGGGAADRRSRARIASRSARSRTWSARTLAANGCAPGTARAMADSAASTSRGQAVDGVQHLGRGRVVARARAVRGTNATPPSNAAARSSARRPILDHQCIPSAAVTVCSRGRSRST